jgi:hypothetical protein
MPLQAGRKRVPPFQAIPKGKPTSFFYSATLHQITKVFSLFPICLLPFFLFFFHSLCSRFPVPNSTSLLLIALCLSQFAVGERL